MDCGGPVFGDRHANRLGGWFATPGGLKGLVIASSLALASATILPTLAIMVVLRVSFVRAAWGWLIALVIPATVVILIGSMAAPFVIEAFVMSTNAMAPTIRGRHWESHCVECSEPAYCTPIEAEYGFDDEVEPPMICRQFHVSKPGILDRRIGPSDRIMVNKLKTPRRWDVIVFQLPEDPSVDYVMRLVGLPGETITIHGGYAWANGKKLVPPASLKGLKYVASIFEDDPGWGSPDRPAVLADDEYFVLGDFSKSSLDSRFWENGAEGHPPYAVPESHLRGVVTYIYWPPSRWREF